jgi:hypothetical protein
MTTRSVAVALLAVGWLVGCSTSSTQTPTSPLTASGFLTDYENLSPSSKDKTRFGYRNPDADFSKYDKVLFDRVHIWRSREDSLGNIESGELQRLADDLYFAIHAQLENDFAFVRVPADGTMQIHMGLTDVTESANSAAVGIANVGNVLLDIFSTRVPEVRLIAEARKPTAGARSLMGAAILEIEIVDASTGDILFTGVDLHLERESDTSAFDSWEDVDEAFAFWASRIATRLTRARRGKR